tara:strand:+ start:186 stop:758 length:573 start_codon:yes stop_codon:yes gene_type:complete
MINESSLIANRIASAMQHLGNLPPSFTNSVHEIGQFMATNLAQDSTLFILGLDTLTPLTAVFCQAMLYRNSDQRPSLPVIALNNQTTLHSPNHPQNYIQLLQALAESGDMVLIACEHTESDSLKDFIKAAIARDITCIIICMGPLSEQMAEFDHLIYLPIEADNLARMHELSLFIFNGFSDIIEDQLFAI